MILSTNENVAYYNGNKYSSIHVLDKSNSMNGAKRVIIFCIMTTMLPTALIIMPLYLRHIVFADVTYTVAESDVIEINNGISSIFCSAHSLQMNSSFNARQLNYTPEVSTTLKHIRLTKSMTLPDDTLEYWGFYLLKGATVHLKVCSRYEGSRILVVRGERNLRTCGLMEHDMKKIGATMDDEYKQVKVTFESAQEIDESNNAKTADTVNSAMENTTDDDKINLDIDSIYKVNKTDSNNLKKSSNSTKKSTKIFKKSGKYDKQTGQASSHRGRHGHYNSVEKRDLTKKQSKLEANRSKRDVGHLLDGKIEHGGNAINYTEVFSDENSESSFESSLLTCYNGQILLTEGFPPSHLCTDVRYLENGERMETVHNVVSDGYYYYIFYSDNDYISNDIHAIFDIHKPVLKFTNITQSKKCINKTECTFPISFWSDERVIVEVPMKDGIEREGDDFTFLISTCRPRMSIYVIFPVAVIFFVLGCAFM